MTVTTSELQQEVNDRSQLAASNKLELLCFNVSGADILYAINVFKVREVILRANHAIERVANTKTSIVEGVITHRLGILPIINLARWLGEETDEEDDKIIICEYNQNNVGLLASRDALIIRKNWEEILEPPPPLLETGRISNTDGNHERTVYILDVEAVLQEIAPHFLKIREDNLQRTHSASIVGAVRRILVAEDSHVARSQLERHFGLLGITDYLLFPNGSQLVEYMSTVEPADVGLVITDLEMPEMSGFVVIKKLRNQEKWRELPILVHSSMSEQNNAREALALGASGFIPKLDPTGLADAIRRHTQRHQTNGPASHRLEAKQTIAFIAGLRLALTARRNMVIRVDTLHSYPLTPIRFFTGKRARDGRFSPPKGRRYPSALALLGRHPLFKATRRPTPDPFAFETPGRVTSLRTCVRYDGDSGIVWSEESVAYMKNH